jgi:hypothetical protein
MNFGKEAYMVRSIGEIYRDWLTQGHIDGDNNRCAKCELSYESFVASPLSCEQNQASRKGICRLIAEIFAAASMRQFSIGFGEMDHTRHSWWSAQVD